MADTLTDPKTAGFEAIVGFNWGVTRLGSEAVLLNLSHPRFGGLSYVMPIDMARALLSRIQEVLSAPPPGTPAPVNPTLQ